MKKIKLSILFLAFFISCLDGRSQLYESNDTISCLQLNDILAQTKEYFKSNFLLLNKPTSDLVFLKQYHKNEFLSLAKDSISYNQILSFIDLKMNNEKLWNSSCIKVVKVLSEERSNKTVGAINDKKKKCVRQKVSYPVIAITEPYLFGESKMCLIGIDYYSGATSGSFGYYLFQKEKEQWRFKNQIFEMLK